MVNVYPGAKVISAHFTNYRICAPKRGGFDLVVIHITSGHADPMGTARRFAKEDRPPPGKKPKRSSAHFVIGQLPENDEPIIQCVDLGDIAYHAHAVNERSVGIEHCAREPGEPGFPKGDRGLPLTAPQYAKSARLGAWLARVGGFPADRAHFQGHAEADPTTSHTGCPLAAGWDWARFMDLLADAVRDLAET